MNLRKLIEQNFPAGTKITSRFPFEGYRIKTPTGGTMIVTGREFTDVRGGADLYEGAVRLGAALWGTVKACGKIEHIAHMALAGQRQGVYTEAGETKRFFGIIKTPPPALPRASGMFGAQEISWTDAELSRAKLLGWPYGAGVRIGSSLETHAPLRYADDDAEMSITGIGPSGSGKGTAFQISACLEFTGGQVPVDLSGQLTAVCLPEWQRRGYRVLPIMPYTEDFPASIAALFPNGTRGFNIMYPLNPRSEAFTGDCSAIGQLLRPEDEKTGGEPFWPLSARTTISVFIACVKMYADPAEQNLTEVYYALGNAFNFARSMVAKPDLPRLLRTPLNEFTQIGAATNSTLNSILKTATNEISWLKDPAFARVVRTSSFDWDDLKNGPRPVVVPLLLPTTKVRSSGPFLRLFAGAALLGLGKTGRGKRKVLVTVDEAALSYTPLFKDAFAEIRKRGVQLSVWWQDITQPPRVAGPDWKTMLSASDIQLFLPPRDPDTAQFISHLAGGKTVVTPHFSYAPERDGTTRESVSFTEHGRPVIYPAETMALPRGTALLYAPGRSSNMLKLYARPYWNDPELKHKAGVDPYHVHKTQKQ